MLCSIPSFILGFTIVSIHYDQRVSFFNFYEELIYIFSLILVFGLSLIAYNQYLNDAKKLKH